MNGPIETAPRQAVSGAVVSTEEVRLSTARFCGVVRPGRVEPAARVEVRRAVGLREVVVRGRERVALS